MEVDGLLQELAKDISIAGNINTHLELHASRARPSLTHIAVEDGRMRT